MVITLKLEKSGRPFGYLSILGFVFVLVTLIMIGKTAADSYQESRQAKWPSVVATITQQVVRKYSGRHDVWRIESEVRYRVDGENLTSNIHSRVGDSTEMRAMRNWASQHQPGTLLPVRYDPQHHNIVVPVAGDMPESGPQVPDDLIAALILFLLSAAWVIIGRVLQRRQLKPV
jgi:hypothetical protein